MIASVVTHTPDSWARLRAIATAQKNVIWCILAEILYYPLVFGVGLLIGIALIDQPEAATDQVFAAIDGPLRLVYLGLKGVQVAFTWRLCTALGRSGPVALFTFCGCIGLLVLLVINQQATSALRAGGLEVGLLGARLPETPPVIDPSAFD